MFSKASTISALVAFFAVLDSSAALGINCRGSGLCPRAGWDNQGVGSVMQGLRDAMYSANISDATMYNSGDHVICVSQSQKITITPGVTAGVSVPLSEGGPSANAGASLSVGLSGSIGNGGVCVFPQNGGVSLKQARTLMDGLLQHGCTTCGSNPTQPGNNVDSGELTVNYVANPFCIGNCLSSSAVGGAAGSANPTAGKTTKRDGEDSDDSEDTEEEQELEEQLEPRWGKRGERLRLE